MGENTKIQDKTHNPSEEVREMQFTVYGKQITQGSKVSHVIHDKAGNPVMKNGRVVVVTRADNPNLDNWRQQVAAAAFGARSGSVRKRPARSASSSHE